MRAKVDAPTRADFWCRKCQVVHPFHLEGINYHSYCGHVVTIHTVLANFSSVVEGDVETVMLPRGARDVW